MKTNSVSNSLRWVILLLMAAVILPTVCLLWFMTQAMRNVRMAARSQLSSVCRGEVSRVYGPFLEWINTETQQARALLAEKSPYEAFVQLAQAESAFGYEGLFIYDLQDRRMLYPAAWEGIDVTDTPELAEAVRLEFAEQNLEAALGAYRRILDGFSDYTRTGEVGDTDPVLFKRCRLAEARLLEKQGHLDAAINRCEGVQREPLEDAANWYYYTTANVKILDLLEKQGIEPGKQAQHLNDRIANLSGVLNGCQFLSSDQRLMAYDRVRQFGQRYQNLLTRSVRRRLGDLERRMEIERISFEFISQRDDFLTEPSLRLFEKIAGTDLYAFTLHAGPVWAVKVVDAGAIVRELSQQLNLANAIVCRVVNSENEVIAGPEHVKQTPFLAFPIAGYFDWTIAFYEADASGNIFETAARRQNDIYLWTGGLVAVLILGAGAVSIRAISHQMQMNTLKNDFIATVTHELKTPLASMRLLVDTLLDRRYTDEKTADEYLRMIANENKRLTHLIDSFLTFSRMERNKQVFDFQPTRPAEIAAQAAEAIQTKLSNHGCDFTIDVDDNAPVVYADRDAMVTVLVNLLDNACKYGNDDRQIGLRVFADNGSVCFAVKDNGIGISKRQQKKIFSRFYQADSRLSRSVEGCGLGLSIVKFIVDAHKGTIEVESRIGEGSTFTVRVPKLS